MMRNRERLPKRWSKNCLSEEYTAAGKQRRQLQREEWTGGGGGQALEAEKGVGYGIGGGQGLDLKNRFSECIAKQNTKQRSETQSFREFVRARQRTETEEVKR